MSKQQKFTVRHIGEPSNEALLQACLVLLRPTSPQTIEQTIERAIARMRSQAAFQDAISARNSKGTVPKGAIRDEC